MKYIFDLSYVKNYEILFIILLSIIIIIIGVTIYLIIKEVNNGNK